MNKSDFKNGMHVKLRDGSLREYYKGYFIGVEYKEHSYIDFYDVDLKNNQNDRLNIVKVFNKNNNTIWEREKEIDWSKIPVGTKVLVSDTEINWFNGMFLKKVERSDDDNYFRVANSCGDVERWKNCKLVEAPKEEVEVVSIEELENKYESFEDVECYECRYCKYEKFNVCEFAWLLDNYNVTRKDNK